MIPEGITRSRAFRFNVARSPATETRPSRGPWLAIGLCCPVGPSPSFRGRLHSSFRWPGRPEPTSNMTTWVNSQFPRPDFHRQVQRHYGLSRCLAYSRRSSVGLDPRADQGGAGGRASPRPLAGRRNAPAACSTLERKKGEVETPTWQVGVHGVDRRKPVCRPSTLALHHRINAISNQERSPGDAKGVEQYCDPDY